MAIRELAARPKERLISEEPISSKAVVYLSSDNRVSLATDANTAEVLGVSQEEVASGKPVDIITEGRVSVVSDGPISPGDRVIAAPTAGRVASENAITPTGAFVSGSFAGDALAAHSHTSHGTISGSSISIVEHAQVKGGDGAVVSGVGIGIETSGAAFGERLFSTDGVSAGTPSGNVSGDITIDALTHRRTIGKALNGVDSAGYSLDILLR